MYYSPNAIFDRNLFKLSGEKLLICNIMLPTAPGLPEDMIHHSVLAE